MPAPLAPSPPLSEVPTATLRKLLAPVTHTKGKHARFQNWATTFKSQTRATFRPRSVEEVRWVVELARREGVELRASGSGHSPSDLVCTEGYIVNIDRIEGMVEIDPDALTFHALGGTKLSALHPLLRARNLSMSSLGSISDQTLAGCLATATHGSGVTFGNLSSTATFLDLVLPLPGAPVVRVSDDEALINAPGFSVAEARELFKAAGCGLGVMGIVVGVGMRVEKAFLLEEELWTIKWDDFVERWQEIAESAEHVRCFWFPQIGQVKISRLNRTTKPITPPPHPLTNWFFSNFIAKHLHALVLSVARVFPRLLPYHAHFMWTVLERPAPIASAGFWSPQFAKVKAAADEARGSARLGRVPAVEVAGESGRGVARAPEGGEEGERGLTVPRLAALAGITPPLTPEPSEGGKEDELEAAPRPFPMLVAPTYKVDTSENIFNYDCGFPQYTYEGAVPYTRTAACLSDLSTWLTAELASPSGLRTHFPIEIRFTERDDIWLSPTYDQRATYIGAIQYRPFNLPVPYKKYFGGFERILLAHEGRPHWAKSHSVGLQELHRRYERLGDWLGVRERVDPGRVLCNAYVRRHLLGEVGEEVDSRRFKSTGR